MAVTATFTPDPLELFPGAPTVVTLRLHNSAPIGQSLELAATGPLAVYATLEASEMAIASNQILDVAVTLEVPATFEPGTQTLMIEVGARDLPDDASTGALLVRPEAGDEPIPAVDDPALRGFTPSTIASALVMVAQNPAYTVGLDPVRSRNSSMGRHLVRVVNAGNVGIVVELESDDTYPTIGLDIPVPTLTAPPGVTIDGDVRVLAASTFWSGPARIHDFVIRASVSDGTTEELAGTFEQRPRVASWIGPAVAGALLALLLGTIAWFAFLGPWVEDTADDAAAEAIELDRAALQERIDELEAAAAEAEELPLGTPTDIGLAVDPTGGNSEIASDAVDPGETLSVTDLIFQNPTGAVGTASLLRDDEVLLALELANFRDFDLHLVAPYTFDASSEISLRVDCRTPGTDGTGCPVNLSVVGFVDESGR